MASNPFAPTPAFRWPIVFMALATLACTGCPKNSGSTKTTVQRVQEDPLAAVRETLRRERSMDGYRTLVAQLNQALNQVGEAKPEAMSSAEREMLAKHLRLTDEEFKEIERNEFTSLDAHYFDDIMLVHDGLRSLRLDYSAKTDAAHLERANLAYAWAMRQVWLRDLQGMPLPASKILQLGFGSIADRAGLALAVFQQLGLDAGPVGRVDGVVLQPWAVGVRIGSQVYLFDPHAGIPMPGPKGAGVLTLKQARAQPELARAAVGATGIGDPDKAIAEGRVWLCPPLSALAPRHRWMQKETPLVPPVHLGIDLAAQMQAFKNMGETVDCWNPPGQTATFTRLLAYFVPLNDGGMVQAPPSRRLMDEYQRSLIPLSQTPDLLREGVVSGDVGIRLGELFAKRFIEFQMEPGQPRDQQLRGRFDDATRAMIDHLSKGGNMQKRIASESDIDERARLWAEQIRSAAAAYLRLKNASPGSSEFQAAQARLRELEKSSEAIMLLIERAAGEPFAAAVTFQLGLCKYEQAERLSRSRSADAESVADAWQTALGWWQNYTSRFANAAWIPPRQMDHAKRLQADVIAKLGKVK